MSGYAGWIELALAIVLGTIGQLALKLGLRKVPSAARSKLAMLNGPLGVWFCCYAATTLFWLLALRTIPLSQAFPILGLQYALIPLFSSHLLEERLVPAQWGGVALIVFGVAMVGHS